MDVVIFRYDETQDNVNGKIRESSPNFCVFCRLT